MNYTPEIGQDALMRVTVVREEPIEDGVTGIDYIVECPNGTETIAALGHLTPRLTAQEWGDLGQLVQASLFYGRRREAYLVGSVVRDLDEAWAGFQHALEIAAPLIDRLGWA